MRFRAVLLFLITLTACLIFLRSGASSNSPDFRLAYTSAPRYHGSAWLRGGERFPDGASVYTWNGKHSKKLVAEFFASADPEISFDGTRILFAGKKFSSDRWQIWEIDIDGSNLHQVFSSKEDVVRPLYLPGDEITYARKAGRDFIIERRAINGGEPAILFHAPGSALPTDVLRDGRILFQSAYPLGGKIPEIYTVYSDGSGVESYRCDHGKARFGGRQTSSGDIVFTSDRGLGRFTSAYSNELATELPNGLYAGDIADSNRGWVVSRSNEKQNLFELQVWTQSSLMPLLSSGENLVEPRVIVPRPVPNKHPSALHEWGYTNLLALNVYTSKYSFPKESVASVRLYTLGAGGEEVVLGAATVESDGSFYLRAPGDQPLKFELLDRNGKTLKKQAGWMWARGGEQRICIGCHAGPEHAPENAIPAALQRSTVPTDLTGRALESQVGGH